MFQPQNERQGGDVQAHGETHKHHECVRVKREGERAKAMEKGGQAVERDPDRTDNASAKMEHLQ